MRDPKRIEPMLAALRKLWYQYPDSRLGQLISWVTDTSSIFYIEDDKMLAAIQGCIRCQGEDK